ncbi:hypothetical protein Golob_004755, partial [Gossypium lobatum]|nr:hypothetical protein [Gossypium lobatum]
GILDGLLIIQKRGHDRVFIQSDNLEEGQWFLRHAPRENNQVVDGLAKMTFVNKEGLCMFDVSHSQN